MEQNRTEPQNHRTLPALPSDTHTHTYEHTLQQHTADVSHPLLVVSQQPLLMSLLEHYDLRKEKKLLCEAGTNKTLHNRPLTQVIQEGNKTENEQTLPISVKCVVATVSMSENSVFTSELL